MSLLFNMLTQLLPGYLPSGDFQFSSFYIYGLESTMRKDFPLHPPLFYLFLVYFIFIFGHTTLLERLLVP